MDRPADSSEQASDSVSAGGPINRDTPLYAPSRCERDVPPGYLFVFATIADSHIRRQIVDSPKYIKATSISRELLANYVADINSHDPPVDFTVHLGDITDFGLPEEFEDAARILDGLEAPLYPVLGNHDNFQYDRKEGWKRFSGRDSANYSFDHMGFHFLAIDCTKEVYRRPFVECDCRMREWVRGDLAASKERPTLILSHYNLRARDWGARFSITGGYREYEGMAELRRILEEAGNVVAVINGHVHANRVEVHNGIHYIDIGATLVGPPSVRYFYVFPDSVVVTYEYISDCALFKYAVDMASKCSNCFDADEVAAFADGDEADREFTIPVKRRSHTSRSGAWRPWP
jgi:predicted phosphodiesterase